VTSREIVRKTLAFEGPARVAFSFEPSDLIEVPPEIPNPEGEWRKINDREWRRVDEWGNLWGRIDQTSKGEVIQGVLDNLDEVETFPLPDFSNPAFYAKAKGTFAAYPDKWHVGLIHGFTFSIARKLRRLDQYLMDLLLEPEKIHILHDRVDEQIMLQMQRMKEAGADSVIIAEDWGTQTQTLISPQLWREEFKPRFRALCGYAHSLGLKMFMHSCGQVGAIVPDLIETGVDLFQFDQPRLYGIYAMQAWQGQDAVTFWCPVDIQTTLQTKEEALIRQDASEMIERLWRGRGGFIAGFYGDNDSIGLEPKWQEIASDEFLKKGKRELFG
jgi:uroporphyrinogen decarboxylase